MEKNHLTPPCILVSQFPCPTGNHHSPVSCVMFISSGPEFLSVSPNGISDQMVLCHGDSLVHCRIVELHIVELCIVEL